MESREQKCETCGEMDRCRRGKCFVCCRPAVTRDLIRAGVPVGSADGLGGIAKKAKARGKKPWEIQKILELVHPILMENVKVDKLGRLRLTVKKAHWVRNDGWSAGL